jgi:hypothetical protein
MTPQFLIRVSAIVTFVFASVVFAGESDVDAAVRDRASHFAEKDWGYIYYLSLHPHAGDAAKDLERAIRLVVASDTTQQVLERAVPVKVTTGLYRIDLRDLGWRYEDWYEVAYKRNPYALDQMPLIVRADWLLLEMSDRQDSDTYDRLIFGGNNLPKTDKDVLKFFKVIEDPTLTFGIIEGQSGVSVQGTRRAESLPSPRGYAWRTRDVLKLDERRDPVEHPDGNSPFDGSEGIIGMPKLSITTGKRGTLQWYWLNNGKGELVSRAPVDLVRDSTRFRHLDEIRRAGSCIQCHTEGLNSFTRNEFKELIKAGVNIFANEKDRQLLEAFHLSDLKTEISRANDDFQSMVELACGCKSADAVKSFTAAVNRYDAPLSLQDTAEELNVDAKLWTQVLSTNVDLPARLASLPHGGKIPRVAWEEGFRPAFYATHGGQPIKRQVDAQQQAKPAEKQPAEKQNNSGHRR